MIPCAGAFRSFAFSYPGGWTARDHEDSVSLWKTSKGGAIKLSVEHCRRFAEKHAFDPPRMSGDRDAAAAAFTDQEGVWREVRFLASGNRRELATYHASVEDPLEEVEADGILGSLRIVPG